MVPPDVTDAAGERVVSADHHNTTLREQDSLYRQIMSLR